MSASHRVQVVIHGRTYQLAGADPEHTRELARKVDETITRFSDAMPGAESYQLAILAALHLADELVTVRGDYKAYRSRAGASADRIMEAVSTSMAEEVSESAAEGTGDSGADVPADSVAEAESD